MRSIETLFLLLISLSAAAMPAEGQADTATHRMRVTMSPQFGNRRLEGEVTALGSDSLLVRRVDSADVTLPTSGVAKLERYAGRKGHAGKGAWIGALTGAVAGGVAYAIAAHNEGECDEFLELVCEGEGETVSIGISAAAGAAGGALIGAVVGLVIRSDHWQPVDPGTIGVMPTVVGGRPSLALRLRF